MGKTRSEPLVARHGRGKARARRGHGMPCVNRPLMYRDPELQCRLVFVSVGHSLEVTVFSSCAGRRAVVFTRDLLRCYYDIKMFGNN